MFLDFGMNYAERRRFYLEPWLSPRDEKGLLALGLLPNLRGVYRFDDSPRALDAVVISHSHADHSMYVSMLKPEIPVFCGEVTQTIPHSLLSTSPRRFETDITHVTFKAFRTGAKIRIGCFEIEPFHVDHSTPGSYAFLIHTPVGFLVYSGNLRMHCPMRFLTEEFLEEAGRTDPVAMLMEGMKLFSHALLTEGRWGKA